MKTKTNDKQEIINNLLSQSKIATESQQDTIKVDVPNNIPQPEVKSDYQNNRPTNIFRFENDMNLLSKIRYNPLSVISLKDEFFNTIEEFSKSFTQGLYEIQEDIKKRFEESENNTDISVLENVSDEEKDSLKRDYTLQNYVLSIEEKLYFANIFDFKNDVYVDYCSDVILNFYEILHPIYLELYIRMRTIFLDRKMSYRIIFDLVDNVRDGKIKISQKIDEKELNAIKQKLYQAYFYKNPILFKDTMLKIEKLYEENGIIDIYRDNVKKALWLPKVEISRFMKTKIDIFIHFHKLCDDYFFEKNRNIEQKYKKTQGNDNINEIYKYIISPKNHTIRQIYKSKTYSNWIKIAKFFDENKERGGLNVFKNFRDVINSVLSHNLASFLYPFFLYSVKNGLKLSQNHFYILRDTIIYTAKNEREWTYIITFFNDLENLLYETTTFGFHTRRWFNASFFVILFIITGVYIFKFPVVFGFLAIIYFFISIRVSFMHKHFLSSFNTFIKYVLIFMFVINGGLNTVELKGRLDSFVASVKEVDIDSGIVNLIRSDKSKQLFNEVKVNILETKNNSGTTKTNSGTIKSSK